MQLLTKLTAVALIIACMSLVMSQPVAAQSETTPRMLEATVLEIEDREISDQAGELQTQQVIELLVTQGNEKGQTISVEVNALPTAQQKEYEVGDRVQVLAGTDVQGEPSYQISDFVRRGPLIVLAIIFVAITLLVSLKRGALSLLAMALSFAVIFVVILPLILAGWNPILVSLGAALLMIPVTFYLSHGVSHKTTVAVIGTLGSLLFTAVLAHVFIEAANLSGYSSDEAGMIQAARNGELNMQGLILAGMILGLSGVLDDITISQSAIVHQLKEASPDMKFKELYSRAMDVGKDHIASLVNTLVLVYTGAAMPLLLLFSESTRPFAEVVNYEIVAEEIVRTLVVSIGIVLSVPFTTFMAANWERIRDMRGAQGVRGRG